MGLQVWLPLTGDLHNQGLSNITFTNYGGATVSSNGKIGSCYTLNGGSTREIESNEKITLGTTFSIAFWINVISWNANWAKIFEIYKDSFDYIGMCMSYTSNADNNKQLGFHIYKNNGSGGKTGVTDEYFGGDRFHAGEWNHLSVTVTPTERKFYFNGVLIDTNTITTSFPAVENYTVSLGRDNLFKTGLNCYINDFRIYDNCLSPREVKEISKGLVLHYTLATPGAENLLRGTNQGKTNWSISNSIKTMTFEVSEDGLGVKTTITQGDGGWASLLYSDANMTTILAESGKEYTLSFDYKCTKTGYFRCSYKKTNGTETQIWNNIQENVTKINQWVHCSISGTTLGVAANYQCVYIDVRYFEDQTTFQIKNLKIEAGLKSTPWVPATTDSLYTKMGYNNNIEYDVSGFKNNGTKVGELICSTDTPKYNTSTQFDGNDDYISIASNTINSLISGTNPFTFSMWIYHGDNTRAIIFGDYGLSGAINFNVELSTAHNLRFYWDGSPDYNVGYGVTASTWTHIGIVYDTEKLLFYINGVLKNTRTGVLTTKTKTSGKYYLGRDYRTGSTSLNGKLSDFRIYATALSADDILELYHTPVTLTSNGVLMTSGEFTGA